MSPIPEPLLPAVAEYPTSTPFRSKLETASKLFDELLTSPEGWDDQGEKEGVQLYSRVNAEVRFLPCDLDEGIPTVKGETIVTGCTPDQFMATIQLPGLRKRWDARLESGHAVARFTKDYYQFYSVQKGIRWLVSPRDIVGVTKNDRHSDGEIRSIQTSVEDPENAPEQSGKTRATLIVGGWSLVKEGNNTKVTYLVHVELNGSIPNAVVKQVSTEIPLCIAKARDVFYSIGHAPYVPSDQTSLDSSSSSIIIQTETFSPPTTPNFTYTLRFTLSPSSPSSTSFEIVYDHERMFKSGVEVEVQGGGGKVKGEDLGAGKVEIEVGEGAESGAEGIVVVLKGK